MDAIKAPTTIEDVRFIRFVDLLIGCSGRMVEPQRANTLYDEFLAEYLNKDAPDNIANALFKYHERIEAFAANLDQERKELLSDKIGAIAGKIDSKSEGYKVLIDMRDKVKPEVTENEDEEE